jgi:hypothetical protein
LHSSRFAPFIDVAANQWLPLNNVDNNVADRRLRLWVAKTDYDRYPSGELTGLAVVGGFLDGARGPSTKLFEALLPIGAVPPAPGDVSPEAYVEPETIIVTRQRREVGGAEDAAVSIGSVPHTRRIGITINVRRVAVTSLMSADTARTIGQALTAACPADQQDGERA